MNIPRQIMSSHNRQSFCPVPLMFKYNPKLFHFEKMVPSDKPYAACALRSVYVCAELFPLKSFKKKTYGERCPCIGLATWFGVVLFKDSAI